MRFVIAFIVAVMIVNTRAQDFNKLEFTDCGSKRANITQVDMTPMPLYNPGKGFFTFVGTLDEHVRVVSVTLNIIRSVSGIVLPVKCYTVNGKWVGSCTYDDLCIFLQSILTEFQPDKCPPALVAVGVNCTCPFDIKPQTLTIIRLEIDLPDASQTAATFLASGNFDITVTVKDSQPAAKQPYGCGRVKLTIKQKK